MGHRAYTKTGFWILLGFAAGMIVADLTNVKTAEAVATSGTDEFLIATGKSNNPQVEFIWLLDFRSAKLSCIGINPTNGVVGIRSDLDIKRAFDLRGGKPRFMMVTGRLVAQQEADALYIAEISTGQIVGIYPPNPTRPSPELEPFLKAPFRNDRGS